MGIVRYSHIATYSNHQNYRKVCPDWYRSCFIHDFQVPFLISWGFSSNPRDVFVVTEMMVPSPIILLWPDLPGTNGLSVELTHLYNPCVSIHINYIYIVM